MKEAGLTCMIAGMVLESESYPDSSDRMAAYNRAMLPYSAQVENATAWRTWGEEEERQESKE